MSDELLQCFYPFTSPQKKRKTHKRGFFALLVAQRTRFELVVQFPVHNLSRVAP